LKWSGLDTRDQAFLEFVKEWLRFRRDHPVLRRARHMHGPAASPRTGLPEIQWLGPNGATMDHEEWARSDLQVLGWLLAGDAGREGAEDPDDTLFIVFNAGPEAVRIVPPEAIDARAWRRVLTTETTNESEQRPSTAPGDPVFVADHSVCVFLLELNEISAPPG